MLDRLSVQQKLSLLLTLPLAAVALLSVPFVVGRLDDAIAASATVDATRDARDVAALLEDLQQERLLALATLAGPAVDQGTFVSLSAATADRAQGIADRSRGAQRARLRAAITAVDSLDTVRRSVLTRTIAPAAVYDRYHTAAVAVVEALDLTRQPRADVTGLRQMTSLDALLRTNESASQVGAALVVSALDGRLGANLALEAQAARRSEANRFRQNATASQSALLDRVDQGPTAQRVDDLAGRVVAGRGPAASLQEILATTETAITLVRAVQTQILHDITGSGVRRSDTAEFATVLLIILAALLIPGMVWLGMVVSRSVALPLRRLTAAAAVVADLGADELFRRADTDIAVAGLRAPRLAAVDIRTSDEIGELAVAFNRVQATAALLMERQVANRHNVAQMFANIARRTRSLVARQLRFIDEFERNELEEEALSKLYRLDHLTTRLRRSADSLLVVSGMRDEERIATEAALIDVIRSAIAEIEDYQSVQLESVSEITIRPQVVPDLRLLLAELLENATAFSPPGAPALVTAYLNGECRIIVTDHGIGMSDERLAEENARLVERERLDLMPTSMLGLFVVGRLARRHGMRVNLSHSRGQGVTAEVCLPPILYTTERRSASRPVQPIPARHEPSREIADRGFDNYPDDYEDRTAVAQRSVVPAAEIDGRENGFAWFDHPEHEQFALPRPPVHRPPDTWPPPAPRSQPAAPSDPAVPSLPAAPSQPAPSQPAPTARASWPAPTAAADSRPAEPLATPTRGGLTRREPGWHLSVFGVDGAPRSQGPVREPAARPPASVRDPAAERAGIDAFQQGSARAANAGADERGGAARTANAGADGVRSQDQPIANSTPTRSELAARGAFAASHSAPAASHSAPAASHSAPAASHSAPADPHGMPGASHGMPAAARTAPMQQRRGGLTRRVPGAHLDVALRDDERTGPARPKAIRDAEAEKAAMDSFRAGLARAARDHTTTRGDAT
jgi:signal transduction histidine kinase